jgi:hypothetical protein
MSGLRGTNAARGFFWGVRMKANAALDALFPEDSIMTVPLVTALHAAETLERFHLERVVDSCGESGERHFEMAGRCSEDAESITNAILATGATVEHQAEAARRCDLETAQRIIDRRPVTCGVGMSAADVPAARMAMAGEIADALAAERGGLPSDYPS